MKTVRLVRFDRGSQGTFGKIYYPGHIRYTGELPWRNNKSNLSCIPTGTYKVIWALSPRLKKYTYRLCNVPGRGGILIHSANLMGDEMLGYKVQLKGCIAIGEQLGRLHNQKAVLVSRPAVSNFELIMGKQPFLLEISDAGTI